MKKYEPKYWQAGDDDEDELFETFRARFYQVLERNLEAAVQHYLGEDGLLTLEFKDGHPVIEFNVNFEWETEPPEVMGYKEFTCHRSLEDILECAEGNDEPTDNLIRALLDTVRKWKAER